MNPPNKDPRLSLLQRFGFWLIASGRRLEKSLSASADAFEWFFQTGFQNVFGAIGRGLSRFVPNRLLQLSRDCGQWSWHVTVRAFTWLSTLLGGIAARILPGWCIRFFQWLGRTLANWFLLSHRFFYGWWFSREWRKLFWALPAFLMVAPLITVIIASPLQSKSAKIRHYQRSMYIASEDDDQPKQDLCKQKLQQLGFQRMEQAGFMNAITLADDEKFDEADAALAEMAPIAEAGYGPAHVLRAVYLAEGKVTPETGERWDLVETHVGHALKMKDLLPETTLAVAHRLQMELLFLDGRRTEGLEMMRSLVEYYPDLNPQLMRYERSSGDTVKARAYARATVMHFGQEAGTEREITSAQFLECADAHLMLEEEEEARQVLVEAHRLHADDEQLSVTLSSMLMRQFEASLRSGANDKAIETLQQAFDVNPNGDQVLTAIATYLADKNEPLQEFVNLQIQQKRLPSSVMLKAGDLRVGQADFTGAVPFYRQACEINPHDAIGWNNLAWILANKEPIDLEAALESADRAIQENDDPRFRETRGQIHIQLKNWEPAVEDLERALNGDVPNPQEVHHSLMQAYEALGETEKAAAHERLGG